MDEKNRLSGVKTIDKTILSLFDFSALHGSPEMNLEVILDLFTIHTPCALEATAFTEGFASGYADADIFLEHLVTEERALRHRDNSTTIQYQNGTSGTVLLSLPKDKDLTRIKTFDEKKMKVAYVAFDEDLMVVVFQKVNIDYAITYGYSLSGTVYPLEKGILVTNEQEDFSYIASPDLTAFVLK